jgi:hypothetical protein
MEPSQTRGMTVMCRYVVPKVIILACILLAACFLLNRAERAIDSLAQANAELVKANAQLNIVNRHIAEMHVKLADTSRKLDEANANLILTNNRFAALDQVFQKLTPRRQ